MSRRIAVGSKAQYSTLVSDEDYLAVIKFKWTYLRSKRGALYVRRCTWKGEVKTTIMLAHFILERAEGPRPEGHTSDHWLNGDTLDNRRENLRWATPKQQSANWRVRRAMAPELRRLIEEEIPF